MGQSKEYRGIYYRLHREKILAQQKEKNAENYKDAEKRKQMIAASSEYARTHKEEKREYYHYWRLRVAQKRVTGMKQYILTRVYAETSPYLAQRLEKYKNIVFDECTWRVFEKYIQKWIGTANRYEHAKYEYLPVGPQKEGFKAIMTNGQENIPLVELELIKGVFYGEREE